MPLFLVQFVVAEVLLLCGPVLLLLLSVFVHLLPLLVFVLGLSLASALPASASFRPVVRRIRREQATKTRR